MIILLLFYLLVPAAIIYLCRKNKIFGKIGPILILYIIGVIVGNLPIMPENAFKIQDILSSAIVPIAIPMMLFNSDFRKFSIKGSFKTFLCGLIAVITTVIVGYLIFRNNLGDESHKIGGMLMGVYTGGTPNLAALKLMLNVNEETFVILNSYDMIVSFLYLLFMLWIGIKLFRKFLPKTGISLYARLPNQQTEDILDSEQDPYIGIFQKKYIIQILKALGLSLLILAISRGATFLVDEQYFMVVIILLLTTLGIGASFIKSVRNLEKSYDAGIYLVYIFCLVVASMADISNLDFRNGLFMFLYIAFVIFGSLFIQVLLSKLFKVDGDSMIISSVSFIYSPPFVPMMAAAMKNKDVVILGLSIGIVGYAIGNYFGFLISEFFKIL